MTPRPAYPRSLRSSLLLALPLLALGCAADPGPSRDLSLRHVVLYQNGVGYFERAGVLREGRLPLRFREREIDDVLKTLVVVEARPGAPGRKPSTVTALLPQKPSQKLAEDSEATTVLDVVLSPRPEGEISIAYAVPTAAWKSAYRVVLPDAGATSKGALLQAWALIDNLSEEDWSGVKLTLATGAPLTFSTDLRSPRFVKRPNARGFGEELGATGPVVADRTAGLDRDGDGSPTRRTPAPTSPARRAPRP
jgi:hypothetical protein